MTRRSRPDTLLGSWLRRHSLTLVAALGGALGVAAAAGWYAPKSARANTPEPLIATPQVAPERPRDNVQDTVQIALLLDTSSSMDGLINQARSQLWSMVDQIGRMTRQVGGKTRGVKIELALYEYGNDTIPASQGYIRQVLPLTRDLDLVSEKLHGLFTNGGSEYPGQAIETAVTSLAWSKDPAAMKFIFVAGNETFEQGPVTAARAMLEAANQEIHVQLISCGEKEPTWVSAAKLAGSDLLTIDHNLVAQHIASPQDAEILRLSGELNGTYLGYGEDGAVAVARQANADLASAKLSPKVALERAQLKSTKSYSNAHWDMVDAVAQNGNFLRDTEDDKLPAALRGKSLAEKQQIVAASAARRAALQAQIAKLEADRNAFLAAERAKRPSTDAPSLETELMKSTRKWAVKKGYKP